MSSVETDQPEQGTLLVQVTLLGGFSIKIGEQVIKDSSSRGYQLWSLLEYLIAFRHKTISPEEIYAALWEDSPIDNPASALKNLVYRIRSLLGGYDIPFAKSLILYCDNGYQWNNSISCVVDAEEFEQLCRKADNPSLPAELRIQKYILAIGLYSGDFLSGSGIKQWVTPVRTYYRSIYFHCVCQLLELLEHQERFEDMEPFCRRALAMDPLHEGVHRYLMLSLIGQGQQAQAADHYEAVAYLYRQQLGVPLTASLRSLYRQISKPVPTAEMDLDVIQQDLRESRGNEGAFYCDYLMFQNIYQVLSRSSTRTGQNLFLVLLTLTGKEDYIPSSSRCRRLMEALLQVIQIHTRHCDVLARFSPCQYVLLLPAASAEQCDIVIRRIEQMCRQNLDLAGIEMHTATRLADALV